MNRPTTSASNLPRREKCPGSGTLENGLPDNDSEQSREGVLLHDFSFHSEYDRSTLKPNQRDLLESALSLTNIVIERVGNTTVPYKQIAEVPLKMRDSNFTGTPDLLRYYATEPFPFALVIDRKFGYAVVERAELNLQLRSYAVMASDYSGNRLDCVYAAIVQPRASYDERITIAKYEPQDIEDSRKQILSILAESEKPDAPLVPGDDQCRFCRAKLICPAFQSAMIVPDVITPDKALSKTAREAYLLQRLGELNDEQLEKVVAAVRLADMIHDQALDEVRRRGGTEHLEVGKESEVRNVTDVRKALALLSLAGLDKGQTFDCVSKISLKGIEEVVRKKNPSWTWQQAKEWINKRLSSVIEIETRKGRVIHNAKLS